MAQSYSKMGLQSCQIFPNFPSRLSASSDEMAEGMRHLSVNYYEAQEPLRRHVPMHPADDSTFQASQLRGSAACGSWREGHPKTC